MCQGGGGMCGRRSMLEGERGPCWRVRGVHVGGEGVHVGGEGGPCWRGGESMLEGEGGPCWRVRGVHVGGDVHVHVHVRWFTISQ